MTIEVTLPFLGWETEDMIIWGAAETAGSRDRRRHR